MGTQRCVQDGFKYTGVEYFRSGGKISCIAKNERYVFTGDTNGNIVAWHPHVCLPLPFASEVAP